MKNTIETSSATDINLGAEFLVKNILLHFIASDFSCTQMLINKNIEKIDEAQGKRIELDSSTKLNDLFEAEIGARGIFQRAGAENWEDGEFGEFSNQLECFIRNSGIHALEEIQDILREKEIPDELKSETLNRLGEYRNGELNSFIVHLLKWGLNAGSPIIKFGAISGIASFGDKSLIKELEKKHSIEKDGISRKMIISAIEYLKKK